MDEIVKAAMLKWPNVPDCYGWLGLDARGQWWLRDTDAQRAGAFAGANATQAGRGNMLQHQKLIEFMQRNYGCDAQGCWYFQNGPQRVYVELERAPWVLRMSPERTFSNHRGHELPAETVLVDEEGLCYVETAEGLGVLHSMDMHLMADAIEQGVWVPQEVLFAELPGRYGYVLSPGRELDLNQAQAETLL
ncbi:MAG TPA: DUF2946 family protein [Macromonas sp.]|nr:DUF2946 family protein [Macromonas sp.]